MDLPNIKTFVLSAIRPYVTAIHVRYRSTVEALEKLTTKQTDHITELELQIAQLSNMIEQTNAIATDVALKASEAISQLPTAATVTENTRRLKELDYICGQLYDKLYEYMHTGSVNDTYLPDYENTWIPGDAVLTDAELEANWRTDNHIDADAILTTSQEAALSEYITDYRAHHQSSGV